MEELKELQAEYSEWLANLPDNLQDSRTAGLLQEIEALDLSELEMIELPQGSAGTEALFLTLEKTRKRKPQTVEVPRIVRRGLRGAGLAKGLMLPTRSIQRKAAAPLGVRRRPVARCPTREGSTRRSQAHRPSAGVIPSSPQPEKRRPR